jgi:glycosyltransferase involved in cell wall biosynthesis
MSDPWQRPPIATSPVSLLLLAHDAAADLGDVVRAWAKRLDALKRPYEMILVDDGSADDTRARAEALAQERPQLRVLAHPSRLGLGAALRTGVAAAQHPLLCCVPCDRQYDPADFQKLLDLIDQADLVTGLRAGGPAPRWQRALGAMYRALSRVFVGVALTPDPGWRGWAAWRRRWVARWLFGVRLRDPECAFRLFRRSVFDNLPIQSDSDFALVEVLAKANFLGCLMAEVEVAHRPLPSGAALHKDGRPGWRRGDVSRLFHDPRFGPAPPARPAPAPEAEAPADVPAPAPPAP